MEDFDTDANNVENYSEILEASIVILGKKSPGKLELAKVFLKICEGLQAYRSFLFDDILLKIAKIIQEKKTTR